METLRRIAFVAVWPFLFVVGIVRFWLIIPLRILFSRGLRRRIDEGAVFVIHTPFTTLINFHWAAPYSDGVRRELPAGVRLKAFESAARGKKSCGFVPADDPDFRNRFLPKGVVEDPKFYGASVVLWTRQIERFLTPEHDAEPSAAHPPSGTGASTGHIQ